MTIGRIPLLFASVLFQEQRRQMGGLVLRILLYNTRTFQIAVPEERARYALASQINSQGCSFRIELVFGRALDYFAHMEQDHADEGSFQGQEAADILLVEDDVIHANVILRGLKLGGFEHRTEHVTDGAEALEYVRSVNLPAGKKNSIPKLILLDLVLPKIGGLQVLRQLKSDARTKSIPVVALTSSKVAIELLESYKLGVNSYVIKPEDPTQFEKLIADISHYWLTVNEPPPA